MSTIFYDNNPPLARCYKLTILVQPHSKKKNPLITQQKRLTNTAHHRFICIGIWIVKNERLYKLLISHFVR